MAYKELPSRKQHSMPALTLTAEGDGLGGLRVPSLGQAQPQCFFLNNRKACLRASEKKLTSTGEEYTLYYQKQWVSLSLKSSRLTVFPVLNLPYNQSSGTYPDREWAVLAANSTAAVWAAGLCRTPILLLLFEDFWVEFLKPNNHS